VTLDPWANAIAHLDAWVAGEEDCTPYTHLANRMESHVRGHDLARLHSQLPATIPAISLGPHDDSPRIAAVHVSPKIEEILSCSVVTYRLHCNL